MNADPEWNWSLIGPALLLEWLQAWVTFNSYNDEPGSAEHGIAFSSNADAGWTIEIATAGTDLEGRAFDGLDRRTTGVAKIQVAVDERAIRMSCGATELSAALGAFMAWARPSSRPAEMDEEWCLYESDNFPLGWLQTWFARHCDGTWEREHSIRLRELENPGWWFEVDLGGTELAGRQVARSLIERSPHDWLSIEVEDDKYVAYAGPLNLGQAIAAFRDWAAAVGPGEDADQAAVVAEALRKCPHCAATMPADAPVCTGCGQDFDPAPGVLLRRQRFAFLRLLRRR